MMKRFEDIVYSFWYNTLNTRTWRTPTPSMIDRWTRARRHRTCLCMDHAAKTWAPDTFPNKSRKSISDNLWYKNRRQYSFLCDLQFACLVSSVSRSVTFTVLSPSCFRAFDLWSLTGSHAVPCSYRCNSVGVEVASSNLLQRMTLAHDTKWHFVLYTHQKHSRGGTHCIGSCKLTAVQI